MVRRIALVLAVVVAVITQVAGCDPPPKQSEPKKKPTEASTATSTAASTAGGLEGRPPHPNMATAAWGEKVAVHLGQGITISEGDGKQLLADAVNAFHSQETGSEKRALELALKAWKRAPDDVTRGAALAVAACALVVDPTVEGYADRLTDAFGLSIYAGTVDATDATGQGCRALVGAAGGAVRQARTLIDLVAGTPKLADEPRALLALARDATRERGDKFFADAERGLVGRPDSVRVRAALADHLVDLGLTDEATGVIAKRTETPLLLLAARAQLDGGQPAGAIALLTPLSEKLVGVDEPRRAEALFWLAEAHLDGAAQGQPTDLAAALAPAKAAQATLESRPGWQREARYLAARIAHLEGRDDEARKTIQPLGVGTPRSTDAIERRMARAQLTWCAAAKDAACTEKLVHRLEILDVDVATVAVARGAADAAALTSPDAATARKLLAVRRGLAVEAKARVKPTLDALLKDPALRVARALRVPFAGDPAEMARFASAALTGAGPALGEADLVVVVDGLGAFKVKDGEALLAGVEKDASPRIKAAVERARSDLKDPESRKKRIAVARGERSDDDDDHGGFPGVPSAPAPKPVAP